MRLVLGAAVAALLMVTPAMAQNDTAAVPAASCGVASAAPTGMPDGATASRNTVEGYTTNFNAWAEATNQVLACKRARAEAARAEADRLTAEFNTENAALRETIASWTVEVEEFNARNPPRRGR